MKKNDFKIALKNMRAAGFSVLDYEYRAVEDVRDGKKPVEELLTAISSMALTVEERQHQPKPKLENW